MDSCIMKKQATSKKLRAPDWGHLGLVGFSGVVAGALFLGSPTVAAPTYVPEIVSTQSSSVEPAQPLAQIRDDAQKAKTYEQSATVDFEAGVTR